MRHPTELAEEAALTADTQLVSAADTIGMAVRNLLMDNGLIAEVTVVAHVTLREPDGTLAGEFDRTHHRGAYEERASGDTLELG